MNYQNILFAGDSQTFGARTYGCYPIYLIRLLSEVSPYVWRAINCSRNGNTARDLWFQLNHDLFLIQDTYQACLLIGTNDVGESKNIDLFEEYYRQILTMFAVHRYRAVFCGEIPPIHADGHVFFHRRVVERRNEFNDVIKRVVEEFDIAHLVPVKCLERDCYEDPVHFNEKGNRKMAQCFADIIKCL